MALFDFNSVSSSLLGIAKKTFDRNKSIGSVLLEPNEFIYDPSQHTIIIGGKEIKGVVSVNIKKTQASVKTHEGLSTDDTVFSTVGSTAFNINIVLKITSPDVKNLKQLCGMMIYSGGSSSITVIENGFTGFQANMVAVNVPDMKVDESGSDVSFEFVTFTRSSFY